MRTDHDTSDHDTSDHDTTDHDTTGRTAIARLSFVTRVPIARLASVFALITVGAIACSEEGFDPRSVAEQGIRDQIMIELDLESEVSCVEPADTAVGTTFTCEATDADGKVYRFEAEILPDEVVGTRLARA